MLCQRQYVNIIFLKNLDNYLDCLMVDLHLARFHPDVPLGQVVDAAPGSELSVIMESVLQSMILHLLKAS